MCWAPTRATSSTRTVSQPPKTLSSCVTNGPHPSPKCPYPGSSSTVSKLPSAPGSPGILDSSQSLSREVNYSPLTLLSLCLISVPTIHFPPCEPAASLVFLPPVPPPPTPFMPITLKHKGPHVISCLIFSLASRPGPCSVLGLPPILCTKCTRISCHGVFAHHVLSKRILDLTSAGTLPLHPPHTPSIPSPKCFPPLEHLSHCYRGLRTGWPPPLEGVSP